MKYGLMKYFDYSKHFNVGDNIQSLAAKQFLPHVDLYIDRERLANYKGENIKLIMNGWFTHNINNWIPSNDIIPLFVSFHINNTAAKAILNEKGIDYLKKHEPIGCRDQFTVDLLMEKGINAYFTGCLTLTLDSYAVKDSEREEAIYIVDVLHSYPSLAKSLYSIKCLLRSLKNGDLFKIRRRNKHLKKLIDKDLLVTANYVIQEPPVNKITTEEKFILADDLLKKYSKAKLVITSRIHCALPCLAMGTPVIFVNGFDSFVDSCRFEGILDLFNRVDIDFRTGQMTTNFLLEGKITRSINVKNKDDYKELATTLKKICKDFVTHNDK